jgi:hypothetical protein
VINTKPGENYNDDDDEFNSEYLDYPEKKGAMRNFKASKLTDLFISFYYY